VPNDQEFDVNDDESVNVFYDLTVWDADQRSALVESLAAASIPHGWRGNELVVPEDAEDATDDIFERLEREIGPFPVLLDDDEEAVEFELDEWSLSERGVLVEQLIAGEIPHRWDGNSLLVISDAADDVDELLDAIESGDLAVLDSSAPDGALNSLFSIGDNLARSVDDATARMHLFDLMPKLSEIAPPYGVARNTWATVFAAAQQLSESFTEELFDPENIAIAARDLRDRCRPWV
jgi:hypothetical protein